jgi:phage terminase Nu1 subunit (DNA packaging protein)
VALTRAQLAAELDIAEKTVTRWVAAGCPHARGARGALQFDLAAVVEWMRAQGRTGERGRPTGGSYAPVGPGQPPSAERTAPQPGPHPAPGEKPSREELRRLRDEVELRIKELEATKRDRLEREAGGELVRSEDVRRFWASRVELVRQGFDALPSRLAQRCAGRQAEEVHDEARDELERLLHSFAGGAPW